MRNLQISSAITNRESASVDLYFTEISRLETIGPDEEAELARRIRAGDREALDRLVRANLRFVVSVAKKYQYQGLPLSDLINEGNLGMMKAAERFDETRGFKFISFAVWWIRQSILAAIIENARMIRLPMNKIGEITRINRAAMALEGLELREPSQEQLADHLNMSVEKIRDALYSAPWTFSYDAGSDEDGFTLLDKLPGDYPPADQPLLIESQQQEIARLLSGLSARERTIIELTYGLTGERELSPTDISAIIGISAERVRQIRNFALLKLRNSHAL